VSPATLIPRADTEALIEALLEAAASPRRILDFGTGTGALLLAALSEFPTATGVGVDRSEAALAIATANARAAGLAPRAMFVAADWGAPLAGEFEAILANPPYIRSSDIKALMPEVAAHEPRLALDGGADGLTAYRRILPEISRLLTADGVAVLEIGADQVEQVGNLALALGFSEPVLRQDLGGNARAVTLRRGAR
jgi:release factor glutamine methyltransferase